MTDNYINKQQFLALKTQKQLRQDKDIIRDTLVSFSGIPKEQIKKILSESKILTVDTISDFILDMRTTVLDSYDIEETFIKLYRKNENGWGDGFYTHQLTIFLNDNGFKLHSNYNLEDVYNLVRNGAVANYSSFKNDKEAKEKHTKTISSFLSYLNKMVEGILKEKLDIFYNTYYLHDYQNEEIKFGNICFNMKDIKKLDFLESDSLFLIELKKIFTKKNSRFVKPISNNQPSLYFTEDADVYDKLRKYKNIKNLVILSNKFSDIKAEQDTIDYVSENFPNVNIISNRSNIIFMKFNLENFFLSGIVQSETFNTYGNRRNSIYLSKNDELDISHTIKSGISVLNYINEILELYSQTENIKKLNKYNEGRKKHTLLSAQYPSYIEQDNFEDYSYDRTKQLLVEYITAGIAPECKSSLDYHHSLNSSSFSVIFSKNKDVLNQKNLLWYIFKDNGEISDTSNNFINLILKIYSNKFDYLRNGYKNSIMEGEGYRTFYKKIENKLNEIEDTLKYIVSQSYLGTNFYKNKNDLVSDYEKLDYVEKEFISKITDEIFIDVMENGTKYLGFFNNELIAEYIFEEMYKISRNIINNGLENLNQENHPNYSRTSEAIEYKCDFDLVIISFIRNWENIKIWYSFNHELNYSNIIIELNEDFKKIISGENIWKLKNFDELQKYVIYKMKESDYIELVNYYKSDLLTHKDGESIYSFNQKEYERDIAAFGEKNILNHDKYITQLIDAEDVKKAISEYTQIGKVFLDVEHKYSDKYNAKSMSAFYDLITPYFYEEDVELYKYILEKEYNSDEYIINDESLVDIKYYIHNMFLKIEKLYNEEHIGMDTVSTVGSKFLFRLIKNRDNKVKMETIYYDFIGEISSSVKYIKFTPEDTDNLKYIENFVLPDLHSAVSNERYRIFSSSVEFILKRIDPDNGAGINFNTRLEDIKSQDKEQEYFSYKIVSVINNNLKHLNSDILFTSLLKFGFAEKSMHHKIIVEAIKKALWHIGKTKLNYGEAKIANNKNHEDMNSLLMHIFNELNGNIKNLYKIDDEIENIMSNISKDIFKNLERTEGSSVKDSFLMHINEQLANINLEDFSTTENRAFLILKDFDKMEGTYDVFGKYQKFADDNNVIFLYADVSLITDIAAEDNSSLLAKLNNQSKYRYTISINEILLPTHASNAIDINIINDIRYYGRSVSSEEITTIYCEDNCPEDIKFNILSS